MNKHFKQICHLIITSLVGLQVHAQVSTKVVEATIQALKEKDGNNIELIEKGVRQTARLWQTTDGDEQEFQRFCETNYIANAAEKKTVFLKISDYMEGISGHYNMMTLRLMKHLHQQTGPLHAIDEKFGSYSPSTHLQDDFYQNKIAFYIALNYPHYTLKEKEALGNDRQAWAYARLGDRFTKRVPATAYQAAGNAQSDADIYISEYNIFMGHVQSPKGKYLFPKEMALLSHWNLRDEIKANYNKGKEGDEKQRIVYEVMKRIIDQQIPSEVINSNQYEWNPFTNTLMKEGKTVQGTAESTVRYQKLLQNFRTMQGIDQYTGDTYIDRKFNNEMELALEYF
ncbi:MAG: hypothetical protein Q4A54_09530 [Parabacteroides sp.]|nr:hypothetical protein [Parabacteroides sp.]